ncbi:MAG: PIN domain-containing protein [Bifidobacteriaceae bacterium]|nr:PIN domain-containing protein [Bifidobacteriaceae bacterium]
MWIVDVNVLVHAANASAPAHQASRRWLTAEINGPRAVLVPWVSLLGFVRLTTNPRVLPRPLAASEAWGFVKSLLSAPAVRSVDPGPGHAAAVERLVIQAGGNSRLVTDAHIAALALENQADVVTWDTDFALFPGVKWHCPAAPDNSAEDQTQASGSRPAGRERR